MSSDRIRFTKIKQTQNEKLNLLASFQQTALHKLKQEVNWTNMPADATLRLSHSQLLS